MSATEPTETAETIVRRDLERYDIGKFAVTRQLTDDGRIHWHDNGALFDRYRQHLRREASEYAKACGVGIWHIAHNGIIVDSGLTGEPYDG